MSNKPVKAVVKLQIMGGRANPAPPVGTALGPHGVSSQDFCTQFNDKTKDRMGEVVPVVVTIYEDRSFDFVLKTSPAAAQILEAAKVKKGSGEPNKNKVGSITWDQCKEIAQNKAADMTFSTIEQGAKTIAGTARSMGIEVKGKPSE